MNNIKTHTDMKKNYVIPKMEIVVFDSENSVLCTSGSGSGSASADDFVKDDLTENNDFWN